MKFEDYGYIIDSKKSSINLTMTEFKKYYNSAREDFNNIIVDETFIIKKMNSLLLIADAKFDSSMSNILGYLEELKVEYDKILTLKNKDS